MRAKISRISWLKNPKNTLAFLDIEFDGFITVKGWKLMEGQNGRWIAAPSHKGKDKDGNEKWFPDVTFASKEAQQGFQDHILKLVQPKAANNNPENVSDPSGIQWGE